ncbi:Retrovirus-related Pol polyprotein from type-2 retrotransposable element R2DM, partial [Araneus ventricosus]
WTYLGVPFTPTGKAKVKILEHLRPSLEILTKAPLKPQQRLFFLRCHLLPGVYHLLALGRATISSLNKADTVVRSYLRKWLDLPVDTPVPYYYADISDGGLGVPCLRWSGLRLRLDRLNSFSHILTNRILCHSTNVDCFNFNQSSVLTDPAGQVSESYFIKERSKVEGFLFLDGVSYNTAERQRQMWAERLYASVDGRALRASCKTAGQHTWVRNGTSFVPGRDFISMIKTRINALPTRTRTSRGRPNKIRSCRAGCAALETPNHVVQQCFRSHGLRIKRHNAIAHYICRSLQQKGFQVTEEPVFPLTAGTLKRDLVALNNSALVLDVQVVGDSVELDSAHTAKIVKYTSFESAVKVQTGAKKVEFSSVTLNWRGVWSPASAKKLLRLGVITKRDLSVLGTRAIIGSMACHRRFGLMATHVNEPSCLRSLVNFVVRNDMASSGFSCEYCSSWFKTKIGLGVHKQAKHREQYQAEISIPKSKTRWTREAIKGQRRQRKYKDLGGTSWEYSATTCSSDPIGSGSDRSSALPSSSVPVNPVILGPDPASWPFDPGAVERSPPGSAPTVTVPEPSMTSRRVTRSQTKHPPGVEPEVTKPSPTTGLPPVPDSTSPVSLSDDDFDFSFVLF